MAALSLQIPAGYSLRQVSHSGVSPEELMGKLIIWEPPRQGKSYIVSVDVSDGVQEDCSVIDVIRVGDIQEPDEQVAQLVTDSIEPMKLAYLVDPIGKLYSDFDGIEALVAIETNNHGLVTQVELQHHIGYSNFFVWQRYDMVDPSQRWSRTIGWETNRRTRPLIIRNFITAVTTIDERTKVPDYVVNSPFTLRDMRDLRVPEGGALVDAEAAPKCFDDCVMTSAIGCWVAKTTRYGETEPLNEKRRRLSEERARQEQREGALVRPKSYQNTLITAAEIREQRGYDDVRERWWEQQ